MSVSGRQYPSWLVVCLQVLFRWDFHVLEGACVFIPVGWLHVLMFSVTSPLFPSPLLLDVGGSVFSLGNRIFFFFFLVLPGGLHMVSLALLACIHPQPGWLWVYVCVFCLSLACLSSCVCFCFIN